MIGGKMIGTRYIHFHKLFTYSFLNVISLLSLHSRAFLVVIPLLVAYLDLTFGKNNIFKHNSTVSFPVGACAGDLQHSKFLFLDEFLFNNPGDFTKHWFYLIYVSYTPYRTLRYTYLYVMALNLELWTLLI